MRTVVFVDGYNLYYGLLRRTDFKWLDLVKLFESQILDSESSLQQIRYYTAPILGKMSDDPESPRRQRIYLQALLKSHPLKLIVIQGKIVPSMPFKRLVRPIATAPDLESVQVLDFTEKKTDVSLATDLLVGAWTGMFEQAVICSNDTDLEPVMAALRKYHPGIRLGLAAPVAGGDSRKVANDLCKYAHWTKRIKEVHLKNAQLPLRIPGSSITKPDAW